jgi:hypothetical protein
MRDYDNVFKAYSAWVGSYFRREKDEGILRRAYLDLRSRLSEEEQKVWPI